jgi:hypothetical protein
MHVGLPGGVNYSKGHAPLVENRACMPKQPEGKTIRRFVSMTLPRTKNRDRRSTLSLVRLLVSLVCLCPSLAFGLTGSEWKANLPEPSRILYVEGVTEGWIEAAVFENEIEGLMSSLLSCMESTTSRQITGMVQKYMKEHPDKWHHRMSTIIFWTMVEACPQKE